jgi:hypothetical protein
MGTDYRLAYGTHATPEDGRCAMEWVSYLAGEPHSDEPACVSPVLRAFCTTLNDSLEDGPRQRLRPYLARTIGTADDGLDEARSWMAMDWLIRTYAPRWLAVAGLTGSAQRLATLPAVLDVSGLQTALAALGLARRDTRASRWVTSPEIVHAPPPERLLATPRRPSDAKRERVQGALMHGMLCARLSLRPSRSCSGPRSCCLTGCCRRRRSALRSSTIRPGAFASGTPGVGRR